MPSIARNRLRLNQLSGARALEAVFNPGRNLVSEEVAIEIIGFITGKTIPLSEGERNTALKQLQVEPALLNLVCQELNERRQAQDLATISTDLLKGTKDRILADFYERSLKDLGPEVRQFIEEYLLTESGYRRAETLDDALRVAGVKGAAINTLVNHRVLRREERLGIPHIELIHDVLTPIVRERRELRRRKEAGRKRRRRLIIGIGIGIFAIISALVVSAIFAGLYFRAEKSRQRAEELINFMLFDLRDSLTQLGRLDLLDTVASRSLKYFESLPEAELSEESIRNRGVALHNIGDVLKAKGDLIGALQNFQAGKAIFERLATHDPSNTGWQRDLALSYQRIGDAFSAQGNLAEAQAAQIEALLSKARQALIANRLTTPARGTMPSNTLSSYSLWRRIRVVHGRS
jgi:tetratricopeptide (TPR) repeat protein